MKRLYNRSKFRLALSSMFCLMILTQHTLFGQAKPIDNDLKVIIELIEGHNYQKAVNQARELYINYPTNPEVCLILGLGYINLANKPDSAVYFLKEGISQLPETEIYSETGINLQLSLGKAFQMMLEPNEAIHIYDNLLSVVKSENSELINEINREKDICSNAQILLNNPIALKIRNLGDDVNSPYDDHSPLISINGEKMYFTSRRQQNNLSILEDGQYPEKICYAKPTNNDWKSTSMLKNFYRRNDHESAVSLSADGQCMFLFKDDLDGKNLYQSTLANGVWTDPVKLPEPVNSFSSETHCSLSADESTMFFTSDREGGLGGLDIYMTKKRQDGHWGEARNLGANINTKYDEETPMIYLDGKTLYFASEGHNSMGMFDIFYSHMNPDSTWSEPINLGFPINTPGDDCFFVPTIDRNKAYYATSKFADNKGGLDIYEVEFDADFKGELAVVEGKVDQNGVTKTIRILVSRADDLSLVGDYRPDPVSGEYLMFLQVGERYQIKEVRQTIEEVVIGEIEIPTEMSFGLQNQVIVMKDIAMEPPLSPTERVLRKKIAEDRILASLSNRSLENNMLATDYTIQLLALKKQPLRDFSIFNGLDKNKINEYVCKDGYFRYTYNSYNSKELSLGERNQVIKAGKFKDAFVRPVKQIEDLIQTMASSQN